LVSFGALRFDFGIAPSRSTWAAGQKWVPFQGPLELISKWDSWWIVVICTAVGLLAG
jgi:hypothetical protein